MRLFSLIAAVGLTSAAFTATGLMASESVPAVQCSGDAKLIEGQSEEGYRATWCEKSGVRHGPFQEIYSNGELRVRSVYREGRLHGPYAAWSEDGVKTREGNYENGVMEGEWTRWHSNGKLADRGSWKNEKPDGDWTLWYENGNRKAHGGFEQGVRVDEWTFWREDGSLEKRGPFEDGKEVCQWVRWDENGRESFEMKQEALRGCFSAGFSISRVRISGFAALQGIGGRSYSTHVLWAPAYRFSRAFELRGGFGGTVLVGAEEGSRFVAHETGIWAAWMPGRIELELGGGIQTWIGNGGIAPLIGGNLGYRLTSPVFGLISRIIAGGAVLLLNDAPTQQFKAGLEIEF